MYRQMDRITKSLSLCNKQADNSKPVKQLRTDDDATRDAILRILREDLGRTHSLFDNVGVGNFSFGALLENGQSISFNIFSSNIDLNNSLPRSSTQHNSNLAMFPGSMFPNFIFPDPVVHNHAIPRPIFSRQPQNQSQPQSQPQSQSQSQSQSQPQSQSQSQSHRREEKSFPFRRLLHPQMQHPQSGQIRRRPRAMSTEEECYMVQCGGCGADLCLRHDSVMRCSACRQIRYCNEECQRNDWSRHREECKKIRSERNYSRG